MIRSGRAARMAAPMEWSGAKKRYGCAVGTARDLVAGGPRGHTTSTAQTALTKAVASRAAANQDDVAASRIRGVISAFDDRLPSGHEGRVRFGRTFIHLHGRRRYRQIPA